MSESATPDQIPNPKQAAKEATGPDAASLAPESSSNSSEPSSSPATPSASELPVTPSEPSLTTKSALPEPTSPTVFHSHRPVPHSPEISTASSPPLPAELLSKFQCPLQPTNSPYCWTCQPAYKSQQEASSFMGDLAVCPFGHRPPDETTNVLEPISPYFCLEHLRDECALKTFTIDKDSALRRCLYGLHPSAAQLANLPPYLAAITAHYRLVSVQQSALCAECGKPIQHSHCNYSVPTECTHLFCSSCISILQPFEECPICTHMPRPKRVVRSAHLRLPGSSAPTSPYSRLLTKPPDDLGASFALNDLAEMSTSLSSQGRNLMGAPFESELTPGQWCCFLWSLIALLVLIFTFLYCVRAELQSTSE